MKKNELFYVQIEINHHNYNLEAVVMINSDISIAVIYDIIW